MVTRLCRMGRVMGSLQSPVCLSREAPRSSFRMRYDDVGSERALVLWQKAMADKMGYVKDGDEEGKGGVDFVGRHGLWVS